MAPYSADFAVEKKKPTPVSIGFTIGSFNRSVVGPLSGIRYDA